MVTDGIIFDMDGTIWDTCKSVAETWQQAVDDHGLDFQLTEEVIRSCMGLLMEEFAAKAMPTLTDKELLRTVFHEAMAYENKYLADHGGILYPEVVETLTKLSKKVPLFIVSNCQAGYIEAFFQAHQTECFFKDYENPGRTGKAKAENIRLICERNNLKAPIYVGDTQGDFDACKKAGVPFVFAAYGFGDVNPKECAGVIDSFKELTEVVEIAE